jgi:hypothetical protein
MVPYGERLFLHRLADRFLAQASGAGGYGCPILKRLSGPADDRTWVTAQVHFRRLRLKVLDSCEARTHE